MKVSSKYSGECLFELLVGEGVAERVHGAVGVTQEVREHEKMLVSARRLGAESLNQSENVVRGPAGDEGSQDERNRPERFPGAVLRFRLLASSRRILPTSSGCLKSFPLN